VFIHYDGFYDIRGHGMTKKEAEAEAAARRRDDGEIMVRNVGPGGGDGDAEPPPKEGAAIPDEQKRVTAILLQTKGNGPAQKDAIAFLMKPLINKGGVFQAVNPIEQIRKLLVDVVGNIRTMLLVMTVLIIVVSGVGISPRLCSCVPAAAWRGSSSGTASCFSPVPLSKPAATF
jgi:putative ABC transport system permease protein